MIKCGGRLGVSVTGEHVHATFCLLVGLLYATDTVASFAVLGNSQPLVRNLHCNIYIS